MPEDDKPDMQLHPTLFYLGLYTFYGFFRGILALPPYGWP